MSHSDRLSAPTRPFFSTIRGVLTGALLANASLATSGAALPSPLPLAGDAGPVSGWSASRPAGGAGEDAADWVRRTLGISLEAVTEGQRRYGLSHPHSGVLVTGVRSDGSPLRGELGPGDVISRVDGRAVLAPGDLARALLRHGRRCEPARLTVWHARDRRAFSIAAEAICRPAGCCGGEVNSAGRTGADE